MFLGNFEYLTCTKCGKTHKNNEDNFLIVPELNLLMVADGMGGYVAGEVASQMAVQLVLQSIKDQLQAKNIAMADFSNSEVNIEIAEILETALAFANNKIFEDSNSHAEHSGMGSTMVLAWFYENELYLAHVGDSRAYFFGDDVCQLTKDHTVVAELISRGEITAQEALTHPNKNMLTRALGVIPEVKVDITAVPWHEDDMLLLCSDGMSSHLDMEQALSQIVGHIDRSQILPVLTELAREDGSNDDITSILAWYKNSNVGEVLL